MILDQFMETTTAVTLDSTSTSDASVNNNINSPSSNPLSPSLRPTSPDSFPVIRFLQAPVTTVLEYSGVLRPRSNTEYHESESLIHDHHDTGTGGVSNGDNGEVSIRIGEGEGVSGGEREMADSSDVDGGGSHGGDSSSQQRYDMQQVSRWIEQILPFSLLLLIVFVRQHLQGI